MELPRKLKGDDGETIDAGDYLRGMGVSLIEIADDEGKLTATLTTHVDLLRTIMQNIEALEWALDPTLRDH